MKEIYHNVYYRTLFNPHCYAIPANKEQRKQAAEQCFLRVAGAGGGRAAAIIMEENFAAKPQGVRACGQGGRGISRHSSIQGNL